MNWRAGSRERPVGREAVERSTPDGALRQCPTACKLARCGVTGCSPLEYAVSMATTTTPPTTDAPPTTVSTVSEYVAIRPGYCGGKPHIAGHRIKVQHIAVWHNC